MGRHAEAEARMRGGGRGEHLSKISIAVFCAIASTLALVCIPLEEGINAAWPACAGDLTALAPEFVHGFPIKSDAHTALQTLRPSCGRHAASATLHKAILSATSRLADLA